MIELLLQAERALDAGLLDHAERIYWQAIERDPQNAIAVVGLARVAIERGDDRTGYRFALKALELDPEDVTARRLARRMAEVIEYRGEQLPDGPADMPGEAAVAPPLEVEDATAGGPGVEQTAAVAPETAPAPAGPEAAPEAGPPASETPAFGSAVVPPQLVVPARRRDTVARLLRRR